MIKIAFGRQHDWGDHVKNTIDRKSYLATVVDFATFDLDQTDFAVPINLDDCRELRRHGDVHKKYIIPDADVMAMCADKKIFNERLLASTYGWMIPQMYKPGTQVLPYMLKKRNFSSGVDIFAIQDAGGAAEHAARLLDETYFCQAYVPGPVEYATHMLIVDGKAVYHSTNRYEMADEFLVKGNRQCPVREWIGINPDDEIVEDLIGMLKMIGFNGICSIDYKLQDGKIQLLELNPRCGFSLFWDINVFLQAYILSLKSKVFF